jgi:hypothetical protein
MKFLLKKILNVKIMVMFLLYVIKKIQNFQSRDREGQGREGKMRKGWS